MNAKKDFPGISIQATWEFIRDRLREREGELEDPSYDNCHFLPAA